MAICRKGIKKSHVYGIFYSFGQSVIFFAYAAAFSYGADLVDDGEMEFKNVFRYSAWLYWQLFCGLNL